MKEDLENTIFSDEKIKARVRELGARLDADYKDKNPLLIGVLKGSFIFLSDLVRSMENSCEIRFISAKSYGAGTSTSGRVEIDKALDFEVRDRNVVIVEDILDTGTTLKGMTEFLKTLAPASVKICVLLDKPSRREVSIHADYVGFECPNEFVVGYGLDYAESYRNLPYIASLKPKIYSS